MPEKIVATDREDYRFRIVERDDDRGDVVPLVILERLGQDWRKRPEWQRVMSCLAFIPAYEPAQIKKSVEDTMDGLWKSFLGDIRKNNLTKAYWDEETHADYVVPTLALEAGSNA
jgi:hypothetical protein